MNEKEYVNKIELFLNNNNFKTWREVIPIECQKWEKPYRIDLIFYKKDLGYFAVEAKYLNTLGQGGKVAGALEQIKKYRNLTYFNNIKIKEWSIVLHHNVYDNMDDMIITRFIKHFLNYYNVGLLDFQEKGCYTRIYINSFTKKSITIGGD